MNDLMRRMERCHLCFTETTLLRTSEDLANYCQLERNLLEAEILPNTVNKLRARNCGKRMGMNCQNAWSQSVFNYQDGLDKESSMEKPENKGPSYEYNE